jgi:tau tubulin kinase
MKNINKYNINKFFMDPYLKLIEQIGEGAFSKLYSAYDSHIKRYIALKIEKISGKNSNLKSEYDIYKELSHLSCLPKIYNFIPNITNEVDENKRLNCIEMELLGKNLLAFKKSFGYYNNLLTYEILIKCLQDIQMIHDAGYIHRDIKPSNFCLHLDDEKKIIYNYQKNIYFNHDIKVYLIDFGLVKKMKKNEVEIEFTNNGSKSRGFIGTLTYASISAHNREELGKKDDLCSFLFMILDLMEENLPWRNIDSEKEEEILECKKRCLNEPEKYLFLKSTKNNNEIMNIFKYVKNLKFETEPDYNYILNQLSILKNKEIQKILYNNEINNQILILQHNLLTKNIHPNNNETLLNDNRISQQDYIIYKLNKTNNKSIPSLNSTNYSSSLYYKTNYINCISGNNNENFYQSVLKPCNISPNKINATKNLNYLNGNTKYDFNKMINIHPFNFKASSCCNRSAIEPHHEEQCKKTEEKYQDDKSLIEFLLGNTNDDSPKKEENKTDKKNNADKKIKNKIHKKMNIHDKRKCIKFNIVKKDT